MEERTIKVSFDDARDWYICGGVLKKLALQAFSEEELTTPDIDSIIRTLSYRTLTDVQKNQIKALQGRSVDKISAPKLLRIIALYFNGSWEKEVGNAGYFLTKTNFHYCTYSKPDTLGNDWAIVKHESVCYPVTYFKSKEDCKKAFKILKSLDKLNNLYTDF